MDVKPWQPRLAAACLAGALALLSAPSFASALELEQIGDDDSYREPVYVTSDPDDRDRLFVAQWYGVVSLTEGGDTSTFLDITSLVLRDPEADTDDGLLSLAFAPDFATSRRLYVAYVGKQDSATADPGNVHIDQFTVSTAGGGVVPGSRREVLIVPVENHPEIKHYGGQLQFGPDGYLYISTGDGGPQGDPFGWAQDPADLRGKLLRILPNAGGGYSIPPDNPFAGPDGVRDEIWSLGLRNPWRFSFDRLTGDLALTDVGYSSREEVNFEPRSSGGGRAMNFGWNCREGTIATGLGGSCDGTYRDPVLEYPHEFNPCDAIAGGYVVRDPGLEELEGRYVYADHCTGEMRSALLARPAASDDRHELEVGSLGPSSFGEDACGRVYVADLSGPVYRIQDSTPATAAECASPPPAPADTRAPALELESKNRQRLGRAGRIKLRFTSDEDGTLEVDGEVGPTANRRARRRSFPLRHRSIPLEAGAEARASWTFGARRTKRLREGLRRGRRVKALFTYTASDAAGNRVDGEAKVRLTRR